MAESESPEIGENDTERQSDTDTRSFVSHVENPCLVHTKALKMLKFIVQDRHIKTMHKPPRVIHHC